LVSNIKGATQTEVICEQGVQEDIWTEERLTGGCRKLHNEKSHNLHPSPGIIRIINSSRISWAENVA
jgi:hypothetical protein